MEDTVSSVADTLTREERRIEISRAQAKRTAALRVLDEAEERLAELGALDAPARQPPPEGRLSVPAFAAAVGISSHQAYRLLEGGAVPGAFKTHPGVPGSRWFIPVNAPARFLARGEAA